MAVRRILEGTKYDKQASEMLAKSGLFDAETSDKIIEGLFRTDIPAFHGSGHNWLEKYLKGIVRMIIEEADGDPRKAQSFLEECPAVFNDYLTWVKAERPKIGNSLDTEFNEKIHYQDVVQKVEEIQEELHKKSQEELANMEFSNSNYTLVPIDSYEQMHKLYGGRKTGDGFSDAYAGGGGTAWCHTNDKDTYDRWTKGGNKFFVLQSNNWEDIPFNAETNRETEGKDTYGNSLIAILVSKYGVLKNATTRSNHVGDPSDADHQYRTYAELSKIVGFNVENEVMKYCEKADLTKIELDIQGKEVLGIVDSDYLKETGIEIDLVIPDGIEKIGDFAFEDCLFIRSVKFPEGLLFIGDYAFENDENLSVVNIPNSVIIIGDSAFKNTGIKEIRIPSKTIFKNSAFAHCYELENVFLNEGIKEISDFAFSSCSLKYIKIPDSVTIIGTRAFRNNPLETVVMSKNIETICDDAFANCTNLKHIESFFGAEEILEYAFGKCESLENLDLTKCRIIGDRAFTECHNLETVKFSDNLRRIGDKAFEECGWLDNVILPESLEEIGLGAFRSCYCLKNISLPENTAIDKHCFDYTSLGNDEYFIIQNNILYGKKQEKERDSIDVPEGVVEIAEGALIGLSCNTVHLPNSLKKISSQAFKNSSIKEIYIPDSVEEIEREAFSKCRGLISVRLPEHISKIPYDCFNETGLEEVTLPESVIEIESGAFYATKITSVEIPSNVQEIGMSAFGSCRNLKTVKNLSRNIDLNNETVEYWFNRTPFADDFLSSERTTNESYNRPNKLSLYEGDDREEIYKLDIQVEYSIIDKDADYVVDEGTVLDALGQLIEEKISDNKEYICRGNKFSDFNIEYTNCNDKAGILTFEVDFDFMIIGKYFIDKVEYLLRNYSANIDYKGTVIEVQVDSVFPMLRHIN